MKKNTFDRNFDAVATTLLALMLIAAAYPLFFVVIASISDPSKVSMGKVSFWPVGLTFAGYKKVIEYKEIWVGYRNTLMYVVGYTSLSVFITMISGYALARKELPGRRGIMLFMTFTMFFSGGLIPMYLLVNGLGLVGKPIVLVIVGTVSVYNIIVARTFIQSSIPDDLFEAASLDGCNHTKFFFNVVLPLSPALLAVITLFAAVGQWNSWFNAMIYLRKTEHMPLQMVLRQLIVSESTMQQSLESGSMMGDDAAQQAMIVESMKYAVIIVSTLPIMCLYPFVQKYFVKGVMIGSIKG
ncbi:sugar ABC transporter permease [Clostridia bacterium]|nr:sugar ABC transporter permease [Clostridia bacterium]